MSHTCPVCGYPGLGQEPYREDTGGSFEICPSCGIQFGYHDETGGDSARQAELYRVWRQRWIDGGMVWDKGRTEPPSLWNPLEQLKRIDVFK